MENYPGELAEGFTKTANGKGIQITVDAEMAEGSFIQQMRSPSHPIAVTMGTTSVAPNLEPQMYRSSATLSLGSAELDTDFCSSNRSKGCASAEGHSGDTPNNTQPASTDGNPCTKIPAPTGKTRNCLHL